MRTMVWQMGLIVLLAGGCGSMSPTSGLQADAPSPDPVKITGYLLNDEGVQIDALTYECTSALRFEPRGETGLQQVTAFEGSGMEKCLGAADHPIHKSFFVTNAQLASAAINKNAFIIVNTIVKP